MPFIAIMTANTYRLHVLYARIAAFVWILLRLGTGDTVRIWRRARDTEPRYRDVRKKGNIFSRRNFHQMPNANCERLGLLHEHVKDRCSRHSLRQ